MINIFVTYRFVYDMFACMKLNFSFQQNGLEFAVLTLNKLRPLMTCTFVK